MPAIRPSVAVSAALLAALTLPALAGCSGGADPEPTPVAASTAPAAPRLYTESELADALPTADDLGDVAEEQQRCPGSDGCTPIDHVTASASVLYRLDPPAGLSDGDIERIANGAWIDPTLFVSANTYDTEESVESSYRAWLTDADRGSGSIDTPAADQGDGHYRPGMKGESEQKELDVDGWEATLNSRRYSLVDPSGDTSDEILDVAGTAVKGRTRIVVVQSVPAQGRDLGEIEKRVEDTVRKVVDALA